MYRHMGLLNTLLRLEYKIYTWYEENPLSFNMWLLCMHGDACFNSNESTPNLTIGKPKRVWEYIDKLLEYNLDAYLCYVHSDGSSDGTLDVYGWDNGGDSEQPMPIDYSKSIATEVSLCTDDMYNKSEN